MEAKQRERAARNKQLALERLRARKLAALGTPEPPPDLNASSSSDLAVPLTPRGSLPPPKDASTPKEPAEPANQCHKTLPEQANEINPPERMDETDDGGKQSVKAVESSETDDAPPKNQPEESGSGGRDSPSTGELSEMESIPPCIQPDETLQDEGRDQSRQELSFKETLAESEDVPPNDHSEKSVLVSSEDKSHEEFALAENDGREVSTPISNEDVFPTAKGKFCPETMEVEEEVPPKETVCDVAEEME